MGPEPIALPLGYTPITAKSVPRQVFGFKRITDMVIRQLADDFVKSFEQAGIDSFGLFNHFVGGKLLKSLRIVANQLSL